LKKCSREDFANFNATYIYDNIDSLDPIADLKKNKTIRYCFDFPKNLTLPEYGYPFKGGNGTLYNKIKIELNSSIPKSELANIFEKSKFYINYLENAYN
jgi:hypothetical protein